MAARNDNSTKQDGPSPEEETLERLLAEKEGLIPPGFAQKVERDLTGDRPFAVSRRVALAYLERPFSETAKTIAEDRAFAVSAAHVFDVLNGHVQSYEALLGWMVAARTRLMFAIAAREDSEQIFAEGKAVTSTERFMSHIAKKGGWLQ